MHSEALRQTGHFAFFSFAGFCCALAGPACLGISLDDLYSSIATDFSAYCMFALFFYLPWSLALIKRLMGGVTIFGGVAFLIAAFLFVGLINLLVGWALFLWDLGKVVFYWVKAFARREEEL